MKPYQCPQLDQLPENVQTFWEEKQNELGERLLLFSYAIFVNPAHFPLPEKSGILYLMEQNLWFEDFPKPPLFFFSSAVSFLNSGVVVAIGKNVMRSNFFIQTTPRLLFSFPLLLLFLSGQRGCQIHLFDSRLY